MAKVHNLAFDYSAYDNAQEAEAQRAIKYKKNPALKQKTVSVVAVIGICLLVAVVLGTMIYGRNIKPMFGADQTGGTACSASGRECKLTVRACSKDQYVKGRGVC